jgi:nucleoside-diphosphate-sugar epimerase
MRVFVTGAAGFIGRATVEELHKHGHTVLGLSRNDANDAILSNLGAEIHHGNLDDLESLKSGARAADGVLHLAFNHDFSNYMKSLEGDLAAIQAMGDAISGTGKPLVIASGSLCCVKGKLALEDDEPDREPPFAARQAAADLVAELSKEQGIRGGVVRLPPTVHGEEDRGLIPMFADAARKAGYVTLVGDGANRWPAVHRLDAAALFRLVVEKGRAGGVYHAIAEEDVPMKEIVDIVADAVQAPAQTKTMEEALQGLGFLSVAFAADNPCSSAQTQKELGWNPNGSGKPGLLADLKASYFN